MSARWATEVRDLVERFDAWSVLDYGGRGTLKPALLPMCPPGVRVAQYGHGDAYVEFADLVVCVEALEHCDPARVSAVLAHLTRLARKAVFIALTPTAARPAAWWDATLTAAGFTVEAREGAVSTYLAVLP